MCLHLKSEKTRMQTAKKDIVVYKALEVSYNSPYDERSKYNKGDSFTGIIRGIDCEGKISIDEDGEIYFCTNNENLDGCSTIDRLGYKYSWSFDNRVQRIIINGKVMYDKVVNYEKNSIETDIEYRTYYKSLKVEMGETYTSDLINLGKKVEIGLHSFKTKMGAKFLSKTIAKCIIPKGSKYYIGEFTCETSYASDCLTYVEIVK